MGSILLNNMYWDDVAENVVKEDFYRFEHRLIFEEMEKLIAQQSPVDLITLEQALKSSVIFLIVFLVKSESLLSPLSKVPSKSTAIIFLVI